MAMEDPLLGRWLSGIYFAEFDTVVGPQIVFQHPSGPDVRLDATSFDAVSDLVIPGAELSHSMTVIYLPHVLIQAFPVNIANEKYHRNAYFFNVGFLLDVNAPVASFEVRGVGGAKPPLTRFVRAASPPLSPIH